MASLGLLGALAGAGRGVEDYGKGRMGMALDDIKAERLAQAAEAERGFRREERQADRAFTTERQERGFEVAAEQADLGRKHDLTRDERRARTELERARVGAGSKGPGWHEQQRAKLVADADSDYHKQVAEIMSDSVMSDADKEDAIKARQIARESRIATADRLHGGQSKPAPRGGEGTQGGDDTWTDPATGETYSVEELRAGLAGKSKPGPRKDKPAPEASTRQAPEEPSDYIKDLEERTRPAPRGGLIAGAQAATTEATAQSGQAQPMAERLRAVRAEKRQAEAARERIESQAAEPVAAFEERFRELFGALSEGRGDQARTQALLAEARELLEAAPNAARRRALEQIIADLSA